jgi:hypothetical protein
VRILQGLAPDLEVQEQNSVLAPWARLSDSMSNVQLVRDKRQPDGTWLLENTHAGETWFDLEDGDGRPSRWNTLRALRVLDWYDG